MKAVPRYDARGVDTETAAVEAAGIFHEFLDVIVMEGACLLPFVSRAGHVSLTINRSRHAIFHVFDDSEVLKTILACPRAVVIPMARHAIRPIKIAGNVFISFSLFLWFRFVCPSFSMA